MSKNVLVLHRLVFQKSSFRNLIYFYWYACMHLDRNLYQQGTSVVINCLQTVHTRGMSASNDLIYFEEVDDGRHVKTVTDGLDEEIEIIVTRMAKSNQKELFGFGQSSIVLVDKKLYAFGGCNRNGAIVDNALRCFDIKRRSKWKVLTHLSQGREPTARFGHTAVAYKKKIYIFGGQVVTSDNGESNSIFQSCNEFYCYDTKAMEWSPIHCKGKESKYNESPPPRHSHTAIVVGNEMIIFGGTTSNGRIMFDDTWTFNFCDMRWSQISCQLKPLGRELHSAISVEFKMFVVGGRTANGVSKEIWILDLSRHKWSQIGAELTCPRCCHSSIIFKKRLCIFGGCNESSILENFVFFNLESLLPKECSASLKFDPSIEIGRVGHSVCVIEPCSEVVIFGGVTMKNDLNDILSFKMNSILDDNKS